MGTLVLLAVSPGVKGFECFVAGDFFARVEKLELVPAFELKACYYKVW